MSRDDYYREIVENNFNIDEEADKRILAGSMMEAVENQLKEHEPAFVLDIFLSLQRKGYNRKQARTVIASVLIEEMYHILKDQREFDEKKYEADLKKRNRMMTKLISVPEVTLDVEEQINSACRKIYDAISDNDEEEAAVLFLAIWPVMKEYVIHNLYRDGVTGIEKPDIMDVSEMTEYNMDFDSLLPEIGIILCNTHKYEKAIDFSREVLELFSWQHSEPDSYKDDIGQALADMGRENESDAWYQRWLDEEPDNGNCINGYAFCHQIRGDIEGALAIVEEHLRVNESVNLKYYNLYLRAAELYNIIGDMQKASHYSALMEKVSLSKKDVFFAAFEEMGCSKPLTKEKKIYPNDPCLCGSGKKYKKCCGKRCNN